jgi:hypothetical protein
VSGTVTGSLIVEEEEEEDFFKRWKRGRKRKYFTACGTLVKNPERFSQVADSAMWMPPVGHLESVRFAYKSPCRLARFRNGVLSKGRDAE